MALIVRSLLVAACLLIGYGYWLKSFSTDVAIPQGINQDNLIKMQEYVYSPGNHSVVVVGSSLAAKLRSYALPPHTYNLALRGKSAFEGLEILRHSGQTPPIILLEVDVLDRPSDANIIATLFNPVMHPLRQAFTVLRERHQPINHLFALGFMAIERLRPAAAARIREKVGSQAESDEPIKEASLREAPATTQDASLALKMTQAMRREFGHLPDTAVFNQNMRVLRTHIAYFTERGSQVVFFEMPISAVACESPRLNYMRQQLLTIFPQQRFAYLPQPDCHRYTTTDGMHLSDASALRYSQELNRQLVILNSLSTN